MELSRDHLSCSWLLISSNAGVVFGGNLKPPPLHPHRTPSVLYSPSPSPSRPTDWAVEVLLDGINKTLISDGLPLFPGPVTQTLCPEPPSQKKKKFDQHSITERLFFLKSIKHHVCGFIFHLGFHTPIPIALGLKVSNHDWMNCRRTSKSDELFLLLWN